MAVQPNDYDVSNMIFGSVIPIAIPLVNIVAKRIEIFTKNADGSTGGLFIKTPICRTLGIKKAQSKT